MRFLSLQRVLAASCRGSCRLLTIPLRRWRLDDTHASSRSPLRFSGLYVLLYCAFSFRTLSGGSFMTGFFAVAFRTRERTFYSQPGRVSYSRQRSWDLILRRFALVHRVDGVFRLASAPTCRFAWCFAAPVFDAGGGKGLPGSLKHLAAAPGV